MLTREEIKAWLKSPQGMSRAQLAEQCCVSLSCVNNWLADSKTNPIPPAKLQLIERIMEERGEPATPAPTSAEELTAIALMMTKEQRAYLTAAARKCGQTLEEFILAAAIERAERAIGKFNTSQPAS